MPSVNKTRKTGQAVGSDPSAGFLPSVLKLVKLDWGIRVLRVDFS